MGAVTKKENQASAPEKGGEILRRKKEMYAAMMAIAAEGMYGVKLTAELADQAGEGKIKRTKVVKTRFPQEFIDYIKATPHPTCDPLSEDELAELTKEFREAYAKSKYKSDKIKAYYDAIIKQYDAQGYAEDEEEATDDEE